MDSLRLFRLIYITALKNNINKIPVPRQPYSQLNKKQFIKDAEIFLMHPEMFKIEKKNNTLEEVDFLYGINYADLNKTKIDINKSDKYFGL